MGITEGLLAQVTPPDTIAQNTDTIRVSAARKGGVETTINYSARDSIRFDVVQKIMYLFGDAKIDYGTTSLVAEQIQINWETSTVYANGVPDSAGKLVGTPIFKDGEEMYEAEKMAYNYKTKRGKITGAITKQGEGYIHAETVKKNADNELFGQNAQYTTCDLKHPHFFINAHKMKVEPGRKVITGPFNLWIGDVPTPLGFLFGLFPTPKKRASGVIIPTFGETRERGFYLRNGGYYWAVNDYLGMRFMGDIYSLGDYGVSAHGDYYKRYKYRGNFSLEHSTFNGEDQLSTDATVGPPRLFRPQNKTYWVRWNHSPEALGGRGRFSASVNAGSSSYNKVNATDPGQYLSSTFQSAVSYSRSLPNAPINYDIRASHFQNVQTKEVTFNLPDFTLGTNSLYPFRWLAPEVPTGAWYENITNQAYFTYRLNAQNRFTNRVGRDTLDFSKHLDRILSAGQYGADHNFNISLGSYKILKYLNFSPNVAYRESWQFKRLDYRFTQTAAGLDSIETDTISRFSRIYNYSAGASLSTQIYGMYNFKGKKIKAIRHVINPAVSYNFSPDFGDPRYDFYETLPKLNQEGTQRLSRYNGMLYSAPSPFPQSSLNFSLRNSVEMKKVSKKDTVSGFDKVKLIDNLTASGGYNFAADSFNLSDILVQLNTNLFNRISINMTFNFSPYQFYNGRRVNEYEFGRGNYKLVNFTQANFDVSTDLNPENWKREKRESTNSYPVGPETQPTTYPQTAVTALPEYVDFDVKWSLYLGFNASYFNPRYFPEGSITQNRNVMVRGTVNPSEKWKVAFSSGYDMVNKDVTFTKIDLYRDLHCWEMSIGWTPFGYAQGYYVNINVKSSILRDLKFTRNQTYYNR
ncbi:LPS-assembly protein LptD [Adhaeribacter sp. BT258]|uniref:LPS-assembly protein LptD n=1 Tax=Adhaeribacter terrigena TaxID=2793070 RepID=A0ABS1BYE7_9BACT|nr:putative LPS assembly protein LptD [Adhaeribacter terrigena]MBK0401946.1 LPS-assembly protein LptD [Adhaeribacter terrigena]